MAQNSEPNTNYEFLDKGGLSYLWNNLKAKLNTKQDKLTSQTAYSSKGSAIKVPQITTNTLGQVTNITEVTITQPTVNNATLTIQKNGTSVGTFTANASTDTTANITVPTKTSDLTNDSGFLTSHQDISGKENTSNKSDSYTVSSTTTYPNTKALVDGLATKQATLVSGTNIKTINNTSVLGSGNIEIKKNTWYATCSTTNSTQTKVATTSTGDFRLETGSQVTILMSKNNTYAGKAKLDVDNTGAKDLVPYVGASLTRYFWKSNEVISVVYDGTQYVMVDSHTADTTCYGITKLSTAIDSTATDLAATPSAVKSAYDLAASKQDALVSGTNIKTINSTSVLGSGNIAVQPTLVSGTNIKTINSQSILGGGNLDLQDKPVIDTTGGQSITLVNNHEYRYNTQARLTISLPSTIANDFACSLVFSSGSTATVFTAPNTIKWLGDGVDNNAFTPEANTRYNIVFWYDGVNVNAIVRGV